MGDYIVDMGMARHSQKKWYERQKARSRGYEGYVYEVFTADGENYIGCTINSLKKRLWQHRSGSPKATKGKKLIGINELEAVPIGGDLEERKKTGRNLLPNISKRSLTRSHE